MSVINNALKTNIKALSLAIRNRLTKHAHSLYFKGITFYQVSNIDNRINNADQLLTQDIERFSDTLAHLYSDTLKPIVDIGLFAAKLSQGIRISKISLYSNWIRRTGDYRGLLCVYGRFSESYIPADGKIHCNGAKARGLTFSRLPHLAGRVSLHTFSRYHTCRGDCLFPRRDEGKGSRRFFL